MSRFDDILTGMHVGDMAGGTSLEDKDPKIIITAKRTFEPESDFNTVIGYVGDVNSQKVTFTLPNT
jgi:hypothetical protein